ncbi:MAG TPA: hypothetical protein VN717_07380 [Gemmatimonadaceae bacterium]|nr:hypothetical protein [Gemmatimonadaceae bacterium]
MTALARAPWLIALAIAVAGCGNSDAVGGDDADQAAAPASFAGFDSTALASASEKGAATPAGMFYYRMVSGSLDWYAVGHAFGAGRAYRVVLTAADGHEYAVASRKAGGDGSFAAHGVETMLMNRQCVGTEDPSQRPLADALPLSVAIKQDGSPPGSSSRGELLGSRSALPCNGNGDGVFDYVLRSSTPLRLAP